MCFVREAVFQRPFSPSGLGAAACAPGGGGGGDPEASMRLEAHQISDMMPFEWHGTPNWHLLVLLQVPLTTGAI